MPHAASCHPGLIRAYRERRGLTQLELGTRADLSERLVRRAKAGEPVRFDSVDRLAAALSTDSERLTAADLLSDPMAVAQSWVRAYFAHGVDVLPRVAHLFAPDVLMVVHSDPSRIHFAGEHRGLDGIERMIRTGLEQFEEVGHDLGRWFRDGTRVAVLRSQRLRVRGSPPGITFEAWVLNEFVVEDGLIKQIDTYEMPLWPELRPYIVKALAEAADDQTYLLPSIRPGYNPHTTFGRIIKLAGVKAWPKLWQNLRSTRETELLAEGHPMHVVVSWIGNTERIARKHYLQVTEADFDRALKRTPAASAAKSAAPTDGQLRQLGQDETQQPRFSHQECGNAVVEPYQIAQDRT